jgi:microcin C transport system substrate-binding protein
MEKKHDLAYMAWSTSFRPQPWEHFHSENAHKPQTNNVNNLDDPEMDNLINKYKDSTDEKELIQLSLKIQEKISESGGWIPLETVPFTRAFSWRWIRIPDVPGYKTSTEIFDDPAAGGYFWIDENIKNETMEAMKSNKTFAPVTKIITKYKQGYSK